jgi:hypothetical protein
VPGLAMGWSLCLLDLPLVNGRMLGKKCPHRTLLCQLDIERFRRVRVAINTVSPVKVRLSLSLSLSYTHSSAFSPRDHADRSISSNPHLARSFPCSKWSVLSSTAVLPVAQASLSNTISLLSISLSVLLIVTRFHRSCVLLPKQRPHLTKRLRKLASERRIKASKIRPIAVRVRDLHCF